jgi:hypothetical protein
MIKSIGNVTANAIFEKNLPQSQKLTATATAYILLAFFVSHFTSEA